MNMRAKMRVANVEKGDGYETLTFEAVSKNDGYPPDGSDENNTYARYTPQASLRIVVNNPVLLNQYIAGQEYYVDFTRAPSGKVWPGGAPPPAPEASPGLPATAPKEG